jgi:hypothetical protein
VTVEERQQVIADLPGVVGDGVRPQLAAVLEPLRGEGVEPRIGRSGDRRTDRLDPDAALDVDEDMAQLALGALARPAVGGRPERDVLALGVGAEAQRVGSGSRGCPSR